MELAAQVGAAGAHGGMTTIDFDWARKTRRMKEELGMYLEIQTFLPREDPAVFEHAVRVAKEAGATSLRVVCLLGRRYELVDSLAAWKAAVEGFHRQIRAAVPIVEKYKMPLGIENHKDSFLTGPYLPVKSCMIAFDTNVLIYSCDLRDAHRQERALELLARIPHTLSAAARDKAVSTLLRSGQEGAPVLNVLSKYASAGPKGYPASRAWPRGHPPRPSRGPRDETE
jgi:hypothetical protein